MPKFLVETISMFRIRYVVEALEDTHACDEIIMNNNGNLSEFSQRHLDEIVTSTRQLTDEEYISLFNEDNEYCQDWTEEQKFSRVNVIDYSKI